MNNMVTLGELLVLEKEIGSFKFLLIYFASGIGAPDFSCHGFLHWKIWQSQQAIGSSF